MLDGCANDGKARGFFNEFLTEELSTHRKVFEVVGSKMKTNESSNQLSGLGFSSTQHTDVLCRVKGSFNRVVKVTF
jgi:dTDP-4-dehydrorhamnose 3,5-epimerase-like enzyme